MDRIQRLLTGMGGGGGGGGPPADTPQVDTAEQIYISSLALLKMLKHGASCRARGWADCLTASRDDHYASLLCVQLFARARARSRPQRTQKKNTRQAARACRWRSWASCSAS